MMRIVKKLPFIMLVIAVMLVSIVPAAAQTTERTTQEKAAVLGSLKIISGVNGEYYLENPLRRNEAATFIVRLIGKGDYVNQNKSFFSSTPYTDVPSTEWYAPFIGYCYQNGFILQTSSQFKPLDFITDKEFIGMILKALDYVPGTDFTLDTAYDKARETGLITITEYIDRASANPTATRGSAVEIMYRALTMECKGKDKILLQKMIDEGVVTRLQAMALGIIVDTVFTDIKSVESLDLNKIQIILNEPVQSVGGVLIYSDADTDITCSVDSIDGDIVVVRTDPLKEGTDYIIELHDVRDRQGNVTSKLMKLFQGFGVQKVTSSFFRISRIEPVNQRSLKVYFTHPLSINSEVPLYYLLLQENTVIADGRLGRIKAGVLNSDNTGILLSLDSDLLKQGEVYTLSIDGDMMSAYGVRLNDGEGDSMKFVAGDGQKTKFEMVEMAAVDASTMIITFSKEINPFLARQVFNFYLTDDKEQPVPITGTTIDSNGHSLYLKLGKEMVKNGTYFLTINNLNDITRQEYITEKVYTFKADYGSSAKFQLTSATAQDNQTVVLVFNRPLNPEAAADAANYTITRYGSSAGIRPVKAYYDASSPYKVKLYLQNSDKLLKQYEYTVRVDSTKIKDFLGNRIETVSRQFAGTDKNRPANEIVEAVAISTDAVKLTLSQEIGFSANNLLPANFVLEYSTNNFVSVRKVPVSVIYIDPVTVILKFDSLEYNTAYTLKVSELTDFSGNVVKGIEKEFSLGTVK